MYTDYPTIYETTLNQNLYIFIILGIILAIILMINIISLAKIFKKANRSAISAIIPVYNMFVLLEILNLSKWYFIILIIPVVNIYIMLTLAKLFRKSKLFGVGLTFLPFIFYPILAFDKSEYIGINLVAMEGKSNITNIPSFENKEEKTLTVHEEVDEKNQNINISIGGGVYQKQYANDLLNVDQQQAIINTQKTNLENNVINNNVLSDNLVNNNEELSNVENNISNNSTDLITQEKPQEPTIQPINPIIINQADFIKLESNIQNNNIEPEPQQQIKVETNNFKPQEDTPENCPKCGNKLKPGTKICFICGNVLE